jgi:2,3-bisphosphoglycerate-dependent phosphoglycerate mutase
MRTLLLIRHAQPEVKPGIPVREWPLSAAGRAATQHLATRLASGYSPTKLISSEEPKAHKTARILAGRLRLPLATDADLGEHRRARVPYLSQEDWHATMTRFFVQPDALVFGDETARAALDRFSAAVTRCLAHASRGDLALVTHGTVLTLFVAAHNPHADALAFWRALALPDLVALTLPDFQLTGDAGG